MLCGLADASAAGERRFNVDERCAARNCASPSSLAAALVREVALAELRRWAPSVLGGGRAAAP